MIDTPAPAEHRVFQDAEALARGGAEWLCALAVASRGDFAVCLSGGSTPRRLYECLAEPGIASRFPWSRAHWFWGDERFVPHDHRDSNYKMAHDAFLSRVPAPAANVHAIPTEGVSPGEAASAYEKTLARYYGAETLAPGRPLFDAALLGIGEDGHTASLLPGEPALEERPRWVVAADTKLGARITLTYPALDSSRELAFLATGAAKREILRRVQSGERALPAARIRPVGRLHWFTDRAGAPQ